MSIRRAYGSGPFHFVAVVTGLIVSGYAIVLLGGSNQAVMIAIWFAAGLLGHDFLLFPVYALLDRAAARRRRRRGAGSPPWLNFVRVPVVLCSLVLLVWFPLILGVNDKTYRAASGLSTDRFLVRYLVFVGTVFAVSALIYALRLHARRRTHS